LPLAKDGSSITLVDIDFDQNALPAKALTHLFSGGGENDPIAVLAPSLFENILVECAHCLKRNPSDILSPFDFARHKDERIARLENHAQFRAWLKSRDIKKDTPFSLPSSLALDNVGLGQAEYLLEELNREISKRQGPERASRDDTLIEIRTFHYQRFYMTPCAQAEPTLEQLRLAGVIFSYSCNHKTDNFVIQG
jgi:hypothetical protein